jgi:hypothetical protein
VTHYRRFLERLEVGRTLDLPLVQP